MTELIFENNSNMISKTCPETDTLEDCYKAKQAIKYVRMYLQPNRDLHKDRPS